MFRYPGKSPISRINRIYCGEKSDVLRHPAENPEGWVERAQLCAVRSGGLRGVQCGGRGTGCVRHADVVNRRCHGHRGIGAGPLTPPRRRSAYRLSACRWILFGRSVVCLSGWLLMILCFPSLTHCALSRPVTLRIYLLRMRCTWPSDPRDGPCYMFRLEWDSVYSGCMMSG